MKFYLGTHQSQWLRFPEFTDVPLFVSHRRLTVRTKLPEAVGRWALDSGGFTEISMHGGWKTTQPEYIDAVYRYREEIGGMDWAAPQDWMCEETMLARTGKTLQEHQALTIESVLSLRAAAPDLPFIPVLQGNTPESYLDHVEQYAAAGLDLRTEAVVGLGSVCRRQATEEIGALVRDLSGGGLKLHGFGVKKAGVRKYGDGLVSSDSLAWSYRARRSEPLPGHTHVSCSNCPDFALRWRAQLLWL